MTRVNVGVHPKDLTDKHLLAEHREIKRIPNHLRKFGLKSLKGAPNKFKLGRGHVKFFLDKGSYTYKRYIRIHAECKRRGFKVKNYIKAWEIYNEDKYKHLRNAYKVTKKAKKLIQQRIDQRLVGNMHLEPDNY